MHQGFNRIVLTLIRDFNSWLVFSIVKNMPFEFLLWNVIAWSIDLFYGFFDLNISHFSGGFELFFSVYAIL